MTEEPSSRFVGNYVRLHIECVEGDGAVRLGIETSHGIPLQWFDPDGVVPADAGQYELAVRSIWVALCEQGVRIHVDKRPDDATGER